MNGSLAALGRLIADMPNNRGNVAAWRTLNAVRERLELDIEDPLEDMEALIAEHGAPLGEKDDVLAAGYEMLGRLYLGVDLSGQKNAVRRTRRLNRNLMRLNQAIFNFLDPEEKDGELDRVAHFTSVAREILEKGEEA